MDRKQLSQLKKITELHLQSSLSKLSKLRASVLKAEGEIAELSTPVVQDIHAMDGFENWQKWRVIEREKLRQNLIRLQVQQQELHSVAARAQGRDAVLDELFVREAKAEKALQTRRAEFE